MSFARLLPFVVVAAIAVGAIASRYQARRRKAGRRLSGGRKALVPNLFDRA